MVHFFSSALENAANKVMPRISRIMVFVVQNLMFWGPDDTAHDDTAHDATALLSNTVTLRRNKFHDCDTTA